MIRRDGVSSDSASHPSIFPGHPQQPVIIHTPATHLRPQFLWINTFSSSKSKREWIVLLEINSETEVNSKIDARKCASEIEMDLRDDLVGFNLFVGLFFVAHTPLQMYLKKRLPAGAGARGGGGGGVKVNELAWLARVILKRGSIPMLVWNLTTEIFYSAPVANNREVRHIFVKYILVFFICHKVTIDSSFRIWAHGTSC